MVELMPNLYKIEIPLPKNPLKSLNAYVVKGKDRNLLVDTGLNRPECLEAMLQGLAEIGISLDITDLFITHMHADHSGLINTVKTAGSKVFASETDGNIINAFRGMDHWQRLANGAKRHGFDPADLEAAITRHPGYLYGGKDLIDFTFVKAGDILTYGEYSFQCIATPGHTDGHLCLYEAKHRLLLSGDHLLGDITPNITAWHDDENPLRDYLASLEKIEGLDIETVLPAHRRPIADWRGRIEEIKSHHAERLAEVIAILRGHAFSAYEVAARMHWDLTYDSFLQFPVQQKWFATGEAIAHLRYLEDEGKVVRVSQDPVVRYTSAPAAAEM